MAVLAALVIVGLAGFVLPDPADSVASALIGAGAAVAIGYGVRRHRPSRPWPWWVLCAAICLSALGDAAYAVVAGAHRPDAFFPSVADVLYLAMYPVLIAGLLGLTGPRARVRRRTVPLDTMILVSGLGLLIWIFLVTPHLADQSMSPAQRLLSVVYPVGDVLILAAVARLVVVHRFRPAVTLMAAGTAGLLLTDLVYALSPLRGHGPVGHLIDLGWLLFYVGWAAAALHPSMAALTQPPPVAPRRLSPARQAILLGGAALLPSALLAIEAVNGRVLHTPVLTAFAAVTTILIAARLHGVIAEHRRHLAHAEVLRATATELVGATDVPDVRDCLAAAIGQLAPNRPAAFHMIMNEDGGGTPFPADFGATIIEAGALTPAAAAAVAPYPHVLVCPVRLGRHHGGDAAHRATLLVGADAGLLQTLQSPVATLAAQSALALERVALTRRLVQHDSEQYFRALVHNATDVILIVEPGDLRIRYASPSAAGVFGPGELRGACLAELTAPEGRRRVRDQLANAPAGPVGGIADWAVIGDDGQRMELEAICRDLRDEPAVGGVVVTLRDVTGQRRMQRELTYQAYHDSLTELTNRAAFRQKLTEAADRAHQTGTLAGVLFIDLDDFKLVNDTLGHDSGDRLLRLVARRIVGAIRPYDTAARLGGDEFAVLIEHAPQPQAVFDVADRVVAALAKPFELDGRLVSGRASVGVSFTNDGHTAEDLLRQADVALYAAKAEGKGGWRSHDPALDTQTVERIQLRAELEQAVARGEFFLEYQPIVRLADQAAVGFEALLRWNHPRLGRVMPGRFIEIAEDTGTIVPIGNWALGEAIRAAARWPQPPTGEEPYVSVNVSARQFRTSGFAARVLDTLREAGLPTRRLLLEITETLLLGDEEQVWQDLTDLRQAGVRVAIDDFGTGYSALNYLRHTPLDVLKLDRVFTSNITTSQHQSDLVAGILTLADKVNLDAVAEGIEQPAELAHLQDAGCSYGQGYLFARPMSDDQTRDWITAARRRVATPPRVTVPPPGDPARA